MTTSSPQLSIGLPVFNGERYLNESLDSIEAQDFTDWELIISDNASTDSTPDICRARAARDSRIRYRRNNENIGGPANYNVVFRSAEAALFKWASSNDLLADDMLSKCIKMLDDRPDAVLAYPLTYTFEDDTDNAVLYPERMIVDNPSPYRRFRSFLDCIGLNNVLNGVIRSDALRKTKLQQPFYSSDVCMMADLALRGPFVPVPDTIFYRRVSRDATVGTWDEQRTLAHWTPMLERPLPMQNWRFLVNLAHSVLRSRIGPLETWRALAYTAKLAYWRKQDLASEIVDLVGSR